MIKKMVNLVDRGGEGRTGDHRFKGRLQGLAHGLHEEVAQPAVVVMPRVRPTEVAQEASERGAGPGAGCVHYVDAGDVALRGQGGEGELLVVLAQLEQ
jgi:hypothetical protein